MSAFRPQYLDGDVEGVCFLDRTLPMYGTRRRSDDLRSLTLGRARIHLSTERWRVCETWFAPSMAGVDSAGLGEVLQNVLASFSLADRGLLVQVQYFSTLLLLPSYPVPCLSIPILQLNSPRFINQ
jgi:actin-related protein 5